MLFFEEEKFVEDWIAEKVKIEFTVHTDEVKGDVYNVMKQKRKKNLFIDKHQGEKWELLK